MKKKCFLNLVSCFSILPFVSMEAEAKVLFSNSDLTSIFQVENVVALKAELLFELKNTENKYRRLSFDLPHLTVNEFCEKRGKRGELIDFDMLLSEKAVSIAMDNGMLCSVAEDANTNEITVLVKAKSDGVIESINVSVPSDQEENLTLEFSLDEMAEKVCREKKGS